MPPIQADGFVVSETKRNKRTVTARQSWLETALKCLESGRRKALRLDPDSDTDSTVLGTAVHQTFEDVIVDTKNATAAGWPHPRWSLERTQDQFLSNWQEILERTPEVKWVKRKHPAATAYGHKVVERWWAHLYPELRPVACEYPFGPIELGTYEEDGVTTTVLVRGTIDYLDEALGIVDWKTASRPYEPWEKKRWAIQPTVYRAAQRMGMLPPEVPDAFTFVVFPDNDRTPVQRIPVPRDADWTGWLLRQIQSIDRLADRVGWDVEWPLNDQHSLCSPKWCPAWDVCKGAHVELP